MLDLLLYYLIQMLSVGETNTFVHRLLISGETRRCVRDCFMHPLLEYSCMCFGFGELTYIKT